MTAALVHLPHHARLRMKPVALAPIEMSHFVHFCSLVFPKYFISFKFTV
ncbi:hypothetical protein IB211_03186 [Intestinimonas butyriciproducens]|uniref:Uncharacterized protein n=1 Tax=Intestinimonas butyriciproducens TaxID=1297617 RepID=A0A0S2W8C6_9FIRM|nr:hypothetical protein IB211_03186 [Intestinimonas butyriciproducens]